MFSTKPIGNLLGETASVIVAFVYCRVDLFKDSRSCFLLSGRASMWRAAIVGPPCDSIFDPFLLLELPADQSKERYRCTWRGERQMGSKGGARSCNQKRDENNNVTVCGAAGGKIRVFLDRLAISPRNG
jgi:hypothetical protein